MSADSKRRVTTIKVAIVTPLIVAALVLSGAYLGLYLGELTGFSPAILAIVLSTGGLFASLPILVKVVQWFLRRERRSQGLAQS